jgi:hypothetical protein
VAEAAGRCELIASPQPANTWLSGDPGLQRLKLAPAASSQGLMADFEALGGASELPSDAGELRWRAVEWLGGAVRLTRTIIRSLYNL